MNTERRIAHLDGLRGLAIASVLLFHAFARWNAIEPWSINGFIKTLFSHGWLGVQLFFMISGFVIYWTLDRCDGLWQFAVKRWLRLFPAMLLGSLFVYLTAVLNPSGPIGLPRAAYLLPGITFIDPVIWNKVFGFHDMHNIDDALWSIYVEVEFYIFAGLAYFFARDNRGKLIAFIFLTYMFLSALASQFPELAIAGIKLLRFAKLLKFIGADYYGWFLVGIFFYQYWKTGGKAYALLSLGFGAIAIFYTTFDRGLTAQVLAVVVLAVFWLAFLNKTFSRAMANPILVWLGFISYPLYLVHENFVTGTAIKLFRLYDGMPGWFYPSIAVSLALLVAHALARCEPQVKALFTKRLDGVRALRYTRA